MPVRKVVVRRVAVEEWSLVLIKDSDVSRIPSSYIRRVGMAKRYSRILVVLTIIVAIISLLTQDPLHTILTLVVLGIALATREDVLVVESVDGKVLEIYARDRRSVKKAFEDLSKLLTR